MGKRTLLIVTLLLCSTYGFAQLQELNPPKITARFQLDVGMFTEDRTTLAQGAQLRKAYLGMKGKFQELLGEEISSNWSYKVNFDLAENAVSAKDLWGRYDSRFGAVKFGTFKEPFGLENMMSSAGLFMMERSLADALVTGRSLGVTYSSPHLWRVAFDLGFFGESVDSQRDDYDEGHAVTARLTGHPLGRQYGNPVDLHLGVSASRRAYSKADNSFDIDTTPEIEVNGTKLIETGTIRNVRNSLRTGYEVALLFRRLAMLSEYASITTNRGQFDEYSFDGGAVTLGYTLWGKPRRYDENTRKVGKVAPKKSKNGLELVLRYSWIDLNNKDIAGGRERNAGFGVNFMPNKLVRFSTNLIWAKIEKDLIEEEPIIYAARVQIDI
jgi:phosphate-selective porin OprO and OprP